MANLEVSVRREVGIGDADGPSCWPSWTVSMEHDVGAREGSVDRVIAAAVLDDDRRAVRA